MLVALLVVVVAAPVTAERRQQPPGLEDQCVQWNDRGQCVKTVPLPVGDPSPVPVGGGGPGPSGPGAPLPNCRWRSTPPIPGIESIIGPPPPTMASPVLQAYMCDEMSLPDTYIGLPVAFRWVDGAGAAGAGEGDDAGADGGE